MTMSRQSLSFPLPEAAAADFEFLGSFNAILAARIDEDGYVIAANRGFSRLLPNAALPVQARADVHAVFVSPTFDELLRIHVNPSEPLFQGILNLSDEHDVCRSFVGAVHRLDRQLLVLAEYDVDEMERLNAQVVDLNLELAELQRHLARTNRALKASEERLTLLSVTDPLTGLYNRRHFMNVLEQVWEHGKRHGTCLSMIMVDIDFFKKINDLHGHDQGDEVLKALATQMLAVVRKGDLVARLGGEEFAVVLQDTSLDFACGLAERLRHAASELAFEQIPAGITCSYGVASLNVAAGIAALLRQADEALYESKHAGRNRVTVCQDAGLTAVGEA